jgi:hypothetical protein
MEAVDKMAPDAAAEPEAPVVLEAPVAPVVPPAPVALVAVTETQVTVAETQVAPVVTKVAEPATEVAETEGEVALAAAQSEVAPSPAVVETQAAPVAADTQVAPVVAPAEALALSVPVTPVILKVTPSLAARILNMAFILFGKILGWPKRLFWTSSPSGPKPVDAPPASSAALTRIKKHQVPPLWTPERDQFERDSQAVIDKLHADRLRHAYRLQHADRPEPAVIPLALQEMAAKIMIRHGFAPKGPFTERYALSTLPTTPLPQLVLTARRWPSRMPLPQTLAHCVIDMDSYFESLDELQPNTAEIIIRSVIDALKASCEPKRDALLKYSSLSKLAVQVARFEDEVFPDPPQVRGMSLALALQVIERCEVEAGKEWARINESISRASYRYSRALQDKEPPKFGSITITRSSNPWANSFTEEGLVKSAAVIDEQARLGEAAVEQRHQIVKRENAAFHKLMDLRNNAVLALILNGEKQLKKSAQYEKIDRVSHSHSHCISVPLYTHPSYTHTCSLL